MGYALYTVLGLPWPDAAVDKTKSEGAAGRHVLIYGGSTATGTLAIQFAKLYVLRHSSVPYHVPACVLLRVEVANAPV